MRATLKRAIVMIEPDFPAERILATVEADQLYALPWIGPGSRAFRFLLLLSGPRRSESSC